MAVRRHDSRATILVALPKRIASAIIVSAVIIASGCSGTTLHQSANPHPTTKPDVTQSTLTPRPCDTVYARPTKCYWLEVPERRDIPNARTIKLWVAVVTPPSARADVSPTVLLTGGPGYAASPILMNPNLTLVGDAATVVFMDQRGTGRSTPRLDCDELGSLPDSTHPWTERLATLKAVVTTCRDRLHNEHVDLDGYNTVENAADFVALRKALGYPKWGLQGGSYGGRLALELYRQDPEGTARIALDSPVTSSPRGPATLAKQADSALERLSDACMKQPACASANGDSVQHLDQAARLLTSSPHTASTVSPPRVISGDELYSGAISALDNTSTIPLLPGAATALASGNTVVLDALATQLAVPSAGNPLDRQALALLHVEYCADDAAAFTPADRAAMSTPGHWSTLLLSSQYAACDEWHVKTVPAGRLAWPTGDVPTLVVEGQLDPFVPPSVGDEIVRHLTNTQIVVVPGGGHLVEFANDCIASVSIAFINNPAVRPDTKCVQHLPQPFAG